MSKRSPNPSRFWFEIDLNPSGTRIVIEFRLDLLGEVGKQRDAAIARSGELVGIFQRRDLQCGRVGYVAVKPPEPLASQTHKSKTKVAP